MTMSHTFQCMVCGKPTEPCAPLTICEDCKNKPEAEIVRLRHKAWFWQQRADHQSDEIDALEIYLATASQKLPRVRGSIEARLKDCTTYTNFGTFADIIRQEFDAEMQTKEMKSMKKRIDRTKTFRREIATKLLANPESPGLKELLDLASSYIEELKTAMAEGRAPPIEQTRYGAALAEARGFKVGVPEE